MYLVPVMFEQLDTTTFQEYCERKKSVRVVKNTGNSCLLHAVLVGKRYADKKYEDEQLQQKKVRSYMLKASNKEFQAEVET